VKKENYIADTVVMHVSLYFYFITGILTDMPGTPDGTWNLKASLPAKWCFHTEYHHVWATAHTTQISMKVLRTVFPDGRISRFAAIAWSTCSCDLAVPLGLCQKQGIQNTSCQMGDLKQRIQKCI
jgi:hypothetical protein